MAYFGHVRCYSMSLDKESPGREYCSLHCLQHAAFLNMTTPQTNNAYVLLILYVFIVQISPIASRRYDSMMLSNQGIYVDG